MIINIIAFINKEERRQRRWRKGIGVRRRTTKVELSPLAIGRREDVAKPSITISIQKII